MQVFSSRHALKKIFPACLSIHLSPTSSKAAARSAVEVIHALKKIFPRLLEYPFVADEFKGRRPLRRRSDSRAQKNFPRL
ncbi:MAG: hypothetical protein IJR52_08315, partial [Selenomonadaceae bacterium]|nr:hypothetical protein [Selenomonadaceae bacterium]